MQAERSGLAAKLVILVLLIAVSLALLTIQGKLEQAQRELDAMTRLVQAQTEINADLTEDIANSGGADSIFDIARERLGLVEPDEKVFVDVNH